jgi:sarcosine oxidase, subunit gamma
MQSRSRSVTAALRRSFLQARPPADGDASALAELALVDLSLRPRTGFKGRGTPEWLGEQGLILPEPNRAVRQTDGTLAVRLAPREVLLLAPWTGAGGGLVERLDAAWPEGREAEGPPRGYPVPRGDSHFWFLLTGCHVPAMLAKLCGIDFRTHRFAPLQVAQTQAVRLSVIVVRDDTPLPAWHLLADSASADYVWTCLVDAMQEFGGRQVGSDALLTL